MWKSLITIGSALKTPKLGIMCPEQLLSNLFVGINGMSFKNSLAKVYDIMLTPTTGLYVPRLLRLNNLMIKSSITKIIKETMLNLKHPFRI